MIDIEDAGDVEDDGDVVIEVVIGEGDRTPDMGVATPSGPTVLPISVE